MNRTKLLTIAVIGLFLLNLGMLGFLFFSKPIEPLQTEHKSKGEGPKKVIIERLHFDVSQQKQYQLLINAHKNNTEKLHNASKKMHDELFSTLKTEPVNELKADSIIQALSDNQKAIEELNFDHFKSIKGLCKSEQVKDFNILVDELGHLFAPKGRPGF
jgi:periplasmic protein CpxP/Spy